MGRSRGGLTTKVHALTDAHGLPIRLALTPGQSHDANGANLLSNDLPDGSVLLRNKVYDADWIRNRIETQGAAPNIPPKANRRWKSCFLPILYRQRNAIERMFGRLKDFRRIATRYDRLAQNFLAAAYLAAIVCYWL